MISPNKKSKSLKKIESPRLKRCAIVKKNKELKRKKKQVQNEETEKKTMGKIAHAKPKNCVGKKFEKKSAKNERDNFKVNFLA